MLSFSAREFLKRLIKFAEIDDVNGRIVRYSQHSDYIDKHFYVLLELIKADEFIIRQNNKDIVLLDNALIYPRQSRTRFALLKKPVATSNSVCCIVFDCLLCY